MHAKRAGGTITILLLFATVAWAQQAPPLTRADAICLALQKHPALQEAEGRLETAAAAVNRARAEQALHASVESRTTYLNDVPTIALPEADIPSLEIGSHTTWITTLSAQQVFYSGGRIEALVRQATDASLATEALRERTRQQVAFNAERTFLILFAAQQQEQVAEAALTAAEDHLRVAQVRLAERAAPRFDVLRAQVQVAEAQQDVMNAKVDTAVAQAALAQAVGMPEQTFLAVEPAASPPVEVPPLTEALSRAPLQRPELIAADRQVTAAVAGVEAARAERRLTLALATDYQLVTPETPFQFSRWSISVFIRFPLLDGGSITADIQAAQGQQTQTEGARATLLHTAMQEVRTAHARLASAHHQVGVAQERVALAEETLRVAEVRYQAAVATPSEIVDAEAALTRARQGLTRALTEQAIAEASLRLATGAVNTAVTPPEVLP